MWADLRLLLETTRTQSMSHNHSIHHTRMGPCDSRYPVLGFLWGYLLNTTFGAHGEGSLFFNSEDESTKPGSTYVWSKLSGVTVETIERWQQEHMAHGTTFPRHVFPISSFVQVTPHHPGGESVDSRRQPGTAMVQRHFGLMDNTSATAPRRCL